MKISTTAPHPYNIYYIHTSQKWKLSFLGGKPGHEVEERSPLWWSVARIWWCWLPSETLSPASSSPRLKAWRDVRPAASSVHKPSCNAGEREIERERAVKCEDLNDSSTPYKLEIMMKTIKNWKYHFLVVFIGKPGLVLARGQTCQWIPPRSVWYIKQRVFTFKNKYQWKMVSFCFIFNIRKSILCCIFSKF